MTLNRRDFIKAAGATVAFGSLYGCAGGGKGSGHVVVIGGGYGGATVAKYIRMWSNGGIDVTLVEPNPAFVSCPISNLVLAGEKTIADITTSYDGLKKHGVKIVHDTAIGIDPAKRVVTLSRSGTLSYDRVVVSPGIDFMWESVPGLTPALSDGKILHAWKAGPQTVALRKQLESMPDGGVYALCIPKAPYRCPPGPYERASMIAHYFKTKKPKSKVLILDANADVTSKGPLFKKAWADLYGGILEYRGNHGITKLDAASQTVEFEFGDKVKANVLNIVPAQKAGLIASAAGLTNVGGRWCGVDWKTLESTAHKNVHVLGDSTAATAGMPKSGHMTTQHAKVAAGAIVALMSGEQAPEPMVIANTCYSFVSAKEVIHVAHPYVYNGKEFAVPKGAGGVSAARNELEAKYAMAWAKNIWADSLL
ncbi:MAG: NAD(P)/FAD-dependent oxidoreductase [Denitratisoma sp.]|nr:NAD(P)/FAD-dependent oxidoreductase [Denitratisoma sp.]